MTYVSSTTRHGKSHKSDKSNFEMILTDDDKTILMQKMLENLEDKKQLLVLKNNGAQKYII